MGHLKGGGGGGGGLSESLDQTSIYCSGGAGDGLLFFSRNPSKGASEGCFHGCRFVTKVRLNH